MRMHEILSEMPLASYQPIGNFEKPGPFRATDRKLVTHPVNQLKAVKFFEQTPYDFRLFFSNVPGTQKYSETGEVNADKLRDMLGPENAAQILDGSNDAITVVFVGNSGVNKVMLTPWMMAHRFGHAIQASERKNTRWSTWAEAEKYFFTTINSMLEDQYNKKDTSDPFFTTNRFRTVNYNLTPEYNALFNAIGTQRSSRSNEIKRPYEFLYEIFAQYLQSGKVTFNPLPISLGYGKQAWGNPSKYMALKPEYRDELARKQEADSLAYTMELMFNDVMSSCVGNIYVM